MEENLEGCLMQEVPVDWAVCHNLLQIALCNEEYREDAEYPKTPDETMIEWIDKNGKKFSEFFVHMYHIANEDLRAWWKVYHVIDDPLWLEAKEFYEKWIDFRNRQPPRLAA